MTGPVVAATEVSYRRGGRTVLDRASVTAHPGQVLAVVGPSGSGKSSLLAILGGLAAPDSGSVHPLPAGIRTGLVLQAYGLAGLLTAAENVEIALQAAGLDRAEVRARARAALEDVGLTPVADHLVEELSGGQQQRVAVARALVIDPDVLLADELTAELDHASRERVLDLVLGVAHRGGTVVVATHDPDVAARCHAIVRLVDGRTATLRQ